MVRIINYLKRKKEDGKTFFVLELQGGIEMVLSKETKQFYATAKRTYVTSTFDEETCKSLIGTEIPGRVIKAEVDPYSFIIQETGEEIILSHSWIYIPDSNETQQAQAIDKLIADVNTAPMNGQLEPQDVI